MLLSRPQNSYAISKLIMKSYLTKYPKALLLVKAISAFPDTPVLTSTDGVSRLS